MNLSDPVFQQVCVDSYNTDGTYQVTGSCHHRPSSAAPGHVTPLTRERPKRLECRAGDEELFTCVVVEDGRAATSEEEEEDEDEEEDGGWRMRMRRKCDQNFPKLKYVACDTISSQLDSCNETSGIY